MKHVQKPDFVFWRNVRVHVTAGTTGRSVTQICDFSRLPAADVCRSAGSVCTVQARLLSAIVLGCWVPTPFPHCSFTFPPTRCNVPCRLNVLPTIQMPTRRNSFCSFRIARAMAVLNSSNGSRVVNFKFYVCLTTFPVHFAVPLRPHAGLHTSVRVL
jgi:hypothetical protein